VDGWAGDRRVSCSRYRQATIQEGYSIRIFPLHPVLKIYIPIVDIKPVEALRHLC
jgi:hypothetical protein